MMAQRKWVRRGINWVSWDDAFTDIELDLIKKISKEITDAVGYFEEVTTGDGLTRKVDNFNHPKNLDSFDFVKERLTNIINTVNSEYFKFNLAKSINMRSIVYSKIGDYLDWHMDNLEWVDWDQSKEFKENNNIFEPRKLTAVLQISDPSEYSGGELQIMTDGGIFNADKKKGQINIYPGYLVHRVTPLLSGRREILAAYSTGPRFK